MKARSVNNSRSKLLSLAAALVMTPFFSYQVNACYCASPPIREALARADAVFTGKAIEGDEEKEETISDGKKMVLLSGRVRFSVEWAFSGVKRSEVIVRTGDGDCIGVGNYAKGERYLLYAQGNEDHEFFVLLCSRSKHISSADEDLKILSGLSPETCGVRLYGMVGHSGAKITATDPQGQTLEAVSELGRYEIKGVRANVEYTVQAHLPDYFLKNYLNPQMARINTCGWAEVNFYAVYDTSISGRVIGPDGNPVNKAVVELMSSNGTGSWNVKSTVTDSQGRFEFSGMAPGEYLLGINITVEPEKNCPYPPTWYPKAATRQSATIIEIEPGQKLSGYDIRIPCKLAERTIEGKVLWHDGRPADKADVYLSPSTEPGSVVKKSISTDSQGRFKITGYEGVDYYIVASSSPNRTESPVLKWYHAVTPLVELYYAEPPLVELKDLNVTGLNLRLTWDEQTLKDFFEKERKR